MIKIENLSKHFGRLIAVDNLSLEIPPGEIFGFLGPNGAGKTTTVKIISGILHPTSGTVSVAGFNVVTQSLDAKKAMALVPDEPFVYPKLTGIEFLQFLGDLYSVPSSVQEKKIPELLEMFELSRWRGELVETYSHGMRQKLVIAGVLLREPKAVLLDEPMVGLDPKSARKVKELFFKLAADGASIFMCTHILDIAEKLCHRIGIMSEGRLIALGTMARLRELSGTSATKAGEKSLEEIFLSLTAAGEFADIL
ncbi:MAG: ABC transporter ATP-binding protein [bacterium]